MHMYLLFLSVRTSQLPFPLFLPYLKARYYCGLKVSLDLLHIARKGGFDIKSVGLICYSSFLNSILDKHLLIIYWSYNSLSIFVSVFIFIIDYNDPNFPKIDNTFLIFIKRNGWNIYQNYCLDIGRFCFLVLCAILGIKRKQTFQSSNENDFILVNKE